MSGIFGIASAQELKIKDGFSHFIAIKKFSDFKKSTSDNPNEIIFTSPEISTPIAWNELVVSWNADAQKETYLKVEARGIYADHSTKFYTLGLWSPDTEKFPRESVQDQKDSDGNVDTDTLTLEKPGAKIQLRMTLGSAEKIQKPTLKFLGLSFCDTKAKPSSSSPNKSAWGKVLPVIERSQNSYPEEQGWCSPTSLSMVLTHWSKITRRKELALDVPEVARAVFDKNYGTGNWPFNTAFAGSFQGMRSYVTRFSSATELEDWIAAGIPVIISAPWHLLSPDRGNTGAGHLVVCVGFTENGDFYINDPGTNPKTDRVRHIYKRENVLNAWSKSHNTVYLVYPESAKIPKDQFHHWERK
ncbi:MAG: peptidase C39 family protein [Verrucomicrobiota bacterium]|nr:peptidase C39 family protein [Verrucomicrobiota bacterium]